MMRSLWTAASGMKTQQLTVDTIANNLANVNTTGFKKERMEFKSLLYETMRTASSISDGGEPVNLQVGHGVRAAGLVKSFTQGNVESTDNPTDFAVNGSGFFVIQKPDGSVKYSKDGSFKMSASDGRLYLTTVQGYQVLDTNGDPIGFENNTVPDNLVVDEQGNFAYSVSGETTDLGIQFQMVQFKNIAGLKATGDGLYETTPASGDPMPETVNEDLVQSSLVQRSLESSNVQAVEEMVKMIIAQRAYELSSKAIQTSDDMLSTANSLKR